MKPSGSKPIVSLVFGNMKGLPGTFTDRLLIARTRMVIWVISIGGFTIARLTNQRIEASLVWLVLWVDLKGTTMARIVALIVAILWLCVPTLADTVTVSQTLHYTDNTKTGDANGPWFIPPDFTMDHTPYHRGEWEDWGWTHDMSSLVPTGATGVASATLKIRAWNVPQDSEIYPDQDKIYAIRTSGGLQIAFRPVGYEPPEFPLKLPATYLGDLAITDAYDWGNTTFSSLPADVLSDLWHDHALGIFMNIDAIEDVYGYRVSVAYSMLTVNYIVPHTTWEPTMPIYRFWSPKAGQHFFTTSESEKNKLMNAPWSDVWTYEDVAYHTYPDKRQNDANSYPVVSPVYRFWVQSTGEHFFTAKESEKDKCLAFVLPPRSVNNDGGPTGYPSTWTYEGIAFYAIPPDAVSPPSGSLPVYRFWSPKSKEHFYTISESEKVKLIAQYPPSVWTYESIAWYAYP
jgi:hypothetical protein